LGTVSTSSPPDTLRVLCLSRYGRLGASSRVRAFQYREPLADHSITLDVEPLLSDDYVERLYSGRVRLSRVGAAYLLRVRRLMQAMRSKDHDLLWIEKEVLPWIPHRVEQRLLSRAALPYVLDYDDAVFHQYDRHANAVVRRLLGRKLDNLAKGAALVTVGNEYLAARFRMSGAARVETVPTVVDLRRYEAKWAEAGRPVRIGWIGTPVTTRYLQPICGVLEELAAEGNQIVLIGADRDILSAHPSFVSHSWTEQTEVQEIQELDVGIMPLPDGPVERGKCAYKLIQYMACGKPVVASPVGANQAVVLPGTTGWLATTPAEWRSALRSLIGDAALRRRLGVAGRGLVESRYSLQVTAPRLAGLLRSAIHGA